jgi:outer membrane protein OmpA-like peptidoglycan-associated protein
VVEDEPAEPEPVIADAPVVAAAAVIAEPEPSPEPVPLAETRRRAEARTARRRRNLLIAAGAAALVLAVVAFFALSGGSDSGDVASSKHPVPTTRAPATTVTPTTATTTPADQGTTTAAGTSVTVNADVLFDVSSAALSPAASDRLGGVLALAQTDTSRHLLIEGFTDSDGDPALNQQLSEARAQAVAQWLIDHGIDPARISVLGHGVENPIAPNDTPEHKALNRRVVVTLQTATP